MAVVSEGTFYQAKIAAPSYVSSSGYYGYVPPCPIADYENVVVHQQQLGRVGEANDHNAAATTTGGLLSWSLSVPHAMPFQQQQQQHHRNQQELICFNGSAMETDEDDSSRREFVRVSRCENNRCVIPEAAGLRLNGGGADSENIYRVAQLDENAAAAAEARTRANRKRNCTGDPAYLFAGHPANFTKKSRQDGGNGNVRNGARRSGKFGPPAMHHEPTPLNAIGDVGFYRLSSGRVCASTKATVEGCRAAAGNYDSNAHSDLERPCIVTSERHDKFGKSYLDYEILLMETHGCSAYHYHRHQHLDVGVLEAEF